MAKITKIEVQKRRKDRVNIFLDEEFFVGASAEIVYILNLKKGEEVDQERLKEIIKEASLSEAKSKAMDTLNRTSISEKKMRDKLSDYDEDVVETVIESLKRYNLLNDKELANRIKNDNVNIGRCGINKVKQNLYKKGIQKEDIEEVSKDIDEDKEYENALYLAKKRYERVKNEDKNKIYQKLSQHLAYKGFQYDVIKRAISEVMNEKY
jgi:regulatory protein